MSNPLSHDSAAALLEDEKEGESVYEDVQVEPSLTLQILNAHV